MQSKPAKEKNTSSISHKVLTVIGAILCVILVPILIINCTLLVKSYVNDAEVPTFGGFCPLIVLTDSMYPDIKSGDLIICQAIDPSEIKVGDVISFFDPQGNGSSVVTHKVIEILEDGSFRTQGINNNTADTVPVPQKDLVGIYRTRIAGAGNVAMFLQTVPGLIVCIVLPIVLFVAYDVIRRKKYEKAKQDDTQALLAELEALRAQKAAQTESAQPEAEDKTEQ